MKADEIALRWIIGLLRELDVPLQAVGGLAARGYGATRPLADLDFYVPARTMPDIARAAGTYVVRPPSHHRDAWWDLVFMKIEYAGREIELAGAEDARFFDGVPGEWRDAHIDFAASVAKEVCGVAVPVMPLEQLIAGKRALGRQVDHQDVAEMLAAQSRGGG